MKRYLANAFSFAVLAIVGLLYLHNYEVWWAHRGRAAYLAFQSSFFDRSIATLQISSKLLSLILAVTVLLWVMFEVVSRLLLRLFPQGKSG